MELAKIIKKKSLIESLKAMPIGVEQVFRCADWDYDDIRKYAFKLKSKGYAFAVTKLRGVADTFVTRLQ